MRLTNIDATDTISLTDFVAPPPPAGPFVYNVSSSFPIWSASCFVFVLAATLNLTSSGVLYFLSLFLKIALIPIKSTLNSSYFTPVNVSLFLII